MARVPHRKPAQQGLSYFDANQHRLVTIESDVLGIKQKIMDTWPGWFDVYFDDWGERWVIVQHCKDGVDVADGDVLGHMGGDWGVVEDGAYAERDETVDDALGVR